MGELRSRLAKPARRALCGLFILIAVAGCSKQQMLEKASYREDRALARSAIRDVAKGDAEALARVAHPAVRSQLAAALPAMRSGLPQSNKLEVELVDARFIRSIGDSPVRQAYLAYEIAGGGQYALAQMNIRRDVQAALITDFALLPSAGFGRGAQRLLVQGQGASPLRDSNACHCGHRHDHCRALQALAPPGFPAPLALDHRLPNWPHQAQLQLVNGAILLRTARFPIAFSERVQVLRGSVGYRRQCPRRGPLHPPEITAQRRGSTKREQRLERRIPCPTQQQL